MNIQTLDFQTAGALGVLQYTVPGTGSFNCLPADEAIKKGMVQVKETSEAGSVNSLIVLNTSDDFVFLMDGDILAGAKQNRVLNTSVLLAPQSKTVIPVSCVEQGRWNHVSAEFSPTNYSAPAFLRRSKSENVSENLKTSKTYNANQGQVWQDVVHFQRKMNVDSATSNLSDVYDRYRSEFDEGIKKLHAEDRANGVILFSKKEIIHTDYFASAALYSHYFPKILRAAALELYGIAPDKDSLKEAQAKYVLLEFLDSWEETSKEAHPGVGVGTEKRAVTNGLAGMELRYNENLIHCGIFNSKSKKHA